MTNDFGAGTWRQIPEQMSAMLRENAWTVKSLLHAAQISDACADAAAIRLPVLLITGERSPQPYGVMLQGLAPCLKHRRLATIPDASHTMNRKNPNAFNEVLAEFFANPR